jgi:ribonuclease HI
MNDKIIRQSKFRLHERCSNNQAEQVAVLKALEQIKSLQLKEGEEKIAMVNTDSKVTLDTLKNRHKHSILTVYIRNEIKRLEDLD